MRKNFDCLVVGAGPAGLAASIELTRRGWSVLLIDKADFPREKVCGGFIGPENKELLEQYGVLEELLRQDAKPVTHVCLSAPNGKSVRLPLGQREEEFALGFSRKRLDALLLDRARLQGVDFHDLTLIKECVVQGKEHLVRLKNMHDGVDWDIKARHLIRATGAMHGPLRSRQRLFGVSALFDQCQGIGSDVLMHFIPHGHAGINRFEKDRVNVCYVIKEELFKQCSGDHEAIWKFFLKSNPRMQEQMGQAQRLTPWKTTFLDMDRPQCFFDGTFLCAGDAAGLIHPVAGGGISMALVSGAILGALLGEYSPGRVRYEVLVKKYRWMWQKRFLAPSIVSRWAGALGHDPFWSNKVIRVLQWNESFVQGLFHLFHQPNRLKECL